MRKSEELVFHSKLLAHEVGLLNDLSHDNVVKIIGFVENVYNGTAWMVFCWEKDENLREFVRSANGSSRSVFRW